MIGDVGTFMDSILMSSIFCKLCRLKRPSLQIFNESIAGFLGDRKHFTMCYGNLPGLSLNGWYTRSFFSVDFGKIVTASIRVPCTCYQSVNTGRRTSEAVLPDICIPGSSFTMIFVLYVMKDKFMPGSSYTNEQICEKYGIAISTLRRWILLFKQAAAVWNKILGKYIAPEAGVCNSTFGYIPENRTNSCIGNFSSARVSGSLNIVRKYSYSLYSSLSDMVLVSDKWRYSYEYRKKHPFGKSG